MTGFDQVEIMMTSLLVFDEFTFLDIPRTIRIYIPNLKWNFMAVSGEKSVTSGLEKKALTPNRHDIIP